MSPRHRRIPPSIGTAVVATPVKEAMSFPADLIQPPPSQVGLYESAVGERIVKLDLRAQALGQGFGIPFTKFVLNPVPDPMGKDGLALLTAALRELSNRAERVSLERRGGQWGLH